MCCVQLRQSSITKQAANQTELLHTQCWWKRRSSSRMTSGSPFIVPCSLFQLGGGAGGKGGGGGGEGVVKMVCRVWEGSLQLETQSLLETELQTLHLKFFLVFKSKNGRYFTLEIVNILNCKFQNKMDEIFPLLSQGHDSDIKIRRNMSCVNLEWVPLQGEKKTIWAPPIHQDSSTS